MLIKKTLLIKIIVIITAFYLVFSSAEIPKVIGYIKTVNPFYFVLACLFLILAQTVSSLRMRYYFAKNDVNFDKKFAIKLYFTGMFLNNFLPGGIGGDGYKLFLISRLHNFSKMKALKIALSERASGLFILLLMLSVLSLKSSIINIPYAATFILLATIALIPSYFFSVKILLKEQLDMTLGALPYSFFVQLFGVFAIFSLIYGISGGGSSYFDYIVLFLISSVLAILPVSIGGVGLREVTFLYGAKLIGTDSEMGVAIAMLFFAVNMICSLPGAIFWHDKGFRK